MDAFLRILKKRKIAYTITLSILATIIVMNSIVEFGEIIIKNKILLIFSLALFYVLCLAAIKNEVWKDDKHET